MFKKKGILILSVLVFVMFFMMTFAGSPAQNAPIITRNIVFSDGYNGRDLAEYEIEVGKGVTPPDVPTHKDLIFGGWYDYNNRDVKIENFDSILQDTHVIALYGEDINHNGVIDEKEQHYTVSFIDSLSGEVLKEEKVLPGLNASAPRVSNVDGYSFVGWDKSYLNVNSDLTINTIYKPIKNNDDIKYYVVTFIDSVNNKKIDSVTVKEGASVSAPEVPIHENKVFDHWKGTYTNVKKNQTVYAIYKSDYIGANGGADGTADDKQIYTLTINYVFEDGTLAYKQLYEERDYSNRNYQIRSPYIKGYSTKREIVSGTIGDDNRLDRVENVIYIANKYSFEIVTDCSDETICKRVEDSNNREYNYNEEITLPDYERKYTLTYSEGENKTYKTVEKDLIGYCKDSSSCEEMILPGDKIRIEDNVKYYAVYDGSLELTIKDGSNYETPTYDYTFNKWSKYTVGQTIILHSDETIVAEYDLIGHPYTLTINYSFNDDTPSLESNVYTVRYNEEYNYEVPVVTGYTPTPEVVTGKMDEEDLVVNVLYKLNTDPYYIRTHVMGLNGEYEIEEVEYIGVTGKEISLIPQFMDGFTFNTVKSNIKGIVTSDTPLVLNLYYDRNYYRVTYSYEGTIPQGAPKVPVVDKQMYGSTYIVEDKPYVEGYIFNGWKVGKNIVDKVILPDGPTTLKGSFIARDDTKYKVETYIMNSEGKYVKIVEEFEGTTNERVTLNPEEKEGYIVNYDSSKLTGTISATDELVLQVYYDR